MAGQSSGGYGCTRCLGSFSTRMLMAASSPEPLGQLAGQLAAFQQRVEPPQGLHRPRGQALAAPLPQHGAQLVVLGEADAVIAAEQMAAARRQQVPDFPVGVVHDRIEDRQVTQAGVVAAAREVDQVHLRVDVDPELAHARAVGTVAHHRRRHHVPPGRAGDDVGGDLPPGQRPGREVPQRALPRDRLVDARGLVVTRADRAVPGLVGRLDQPAQDLQAALLQQLQGRLVPGY